MLRKMFILASLVVWVPAGSALARVCDLCPNADCLCPSDCICNTLVAAIADAADSIEMETTKPLPEKVVQALVDAKKKNPALEVKIVKKKAEPKMDHLLKANDIGVQIIRHSSVKDKVMIDGKRLGNYPK